MSKHTPGPWEVQMEYCECEPPCGCDNPYPYAIRAHHRKVSPYPKSPETQESADIANLVEVNHPLPIDEARANAYLIAAAPLMYEALDDALRTCESEMQYILDNGRLREVLRAALQAAKGGDGEPNV